MQIQVICTITVRSQCLLTEAFKPVVYINGGIFLNFIDKDRCRDDKTKLCTKNKYSIIYL